MPAAAERRLAPREPGAVAIGLNLVRFAGTLAGFLVGVAVEARRTGDPIDLEPRVLARRPVREAEAALAATR